MTYKPWSVRYRILAGIILMTSIGLAWVWKASLFERMSGRFIALDRYETSLLNDIARLRLELLDVSKYTNIEKTAREQLKMQFPDAPPDTIWIAAQREKPMLTVIKFFPFKSKV